MDYLRIHDRIIQRAKTRAINGYYENHHIVPRCMGGTDESTNLVKLTPEEHYLIHQLLVKIYPENIKLAYAAMKMCQNRPTNKLYGWVRRKYAKAVSKVQSGNGNSQFGMIWITELSSNNTKKHDSNVPIPDGWILGRSIKKKICKNCKDEFISKGKEKFCCKECKKIDRKKTRPGKLDLFRNEFVDAYKNTHSIQKSLRSIGLNGNNGDFSKQAKLILQKEKLL